MTDTTTVLLVTAALFLLPTVAFVWSCRVAPPVKVRRHPFSIYEFINIAVARFEELRNTFDHIRRTSDIATEAFRKLEAAYNKSESRYDR